MVTISCCKTRSTTMAKPSNQPLLSSFCSCTTPAPHAAQSSTGMPQTNEWLPTTTKSFANTAALLLPLFRRQASPTTVAQRLLHHSTHVTTEVIITTTVTTDTQVMKTHSGCSAAAPPQHSCRHQDDQHHAIITETHVKKTRFIQPVAATRPHAVCASTHAAWSEAE
jgi:hypothetical protein